MRVSSLVNRLAWLPAAIAVRHIVPAGGFVRNRDSVSIMASAPIPI